MLSVVSGFVVILCSVQNDVRGGFIIVVLMYIGR